MKRIANIFIELKIPWKLAGMVLCSPSNFVGVFMKNPSKENEILYRITCKWCFLWNVCRERSFSKCYKSRLLVHKCMALVITKHFCNHGFYYQYANEITYYPRSITVCISIFIDWRYLYSSRVSSVVHNYSTVNKGDTNSLNAWQV